MKGEMASDEFYWEGEIFIGSGNWILVRFSKKKVFREKSHIEV